MARDESGAGRPSGSLLPNFQITFYSQGTGAVVRDYQEVGAMGEHQ